MMVLICKFLRHINKPQTLFATRTWHFSYQTRKKTYSFHLENNSLHSQLSKDSGVCLRISIQWDLLDGRLHFLAVYTGYFTENIIITSIQNFKVTFTPNRQLSSRVILFYKPNCVIFAA